MTIEHDDIVNDFNLVMDQFPRVHLPPNSSLCDHYHLS